MTIYVDASTGPMTRGERVGVGFVVASTRKLYYGAVSIEHDGRNPERQAVDFVRKVFGHGCQVFNDCLGTKGATYAPGTGNEHMRLAHHLARMVNLTIQSNGRSRRAWRRAELGDFRPQDFAPEGEKFE